MHAAWDIYAHRLMHLKHGHPLWGPEPSERFGEVRLGDVGYLQEGRFCFLFNTMRSADDPVNSQGVPHDFVVFSPPNMGPVHWPNAITQTQLCSKSLRSIQVDASLSMSEAIATTTAGLRYQCIDDSGALLLLKQPGHKTFLNCKLHIMKYMAKHLDRWCEFANDALGIGLKDKDIIFVSGFTKTTVWAAAAFSDTNRSGELVIAGGCFVPSASGEFRVSISHEGPASIDSRDGPRDRLSAWEDSVAQEYMYDQCIFLNYYKMKRRTVLLGPKVVRAAADYHTLPDEDRDDEDGWADISSRMSASSDSQESDYVGKSYDPVDEILDYILEHSHFDVACASDEDLFPLFIVDHRNYRPTHDSDHPILNLEQITDIPDNLQTVLEAATPSVVVGDPNLIEVGVLINPLDRHLKRIHWSVDPEELSGKPSSSAAPTVTQIAGMSDTSHDFPNTKGTQDTIKHFACPYPNCDSRFFWKTDLRVHIASVHRANRRYICREPGCSHAFSCKHDLVQHHQSKHTNLGSPPNMNNSSRGQQGRV